MYDYTLSEVTLRKSVRRVEDLQDILRNIEEPVFKVNLNL
jgi:endonuclease/exonuclease/phosphatase family metal-dependent hydrolase